MVIGHPNYQYQEYFPLKVLYRILSPAKFLKKYLICAWKLSLHKGNYALKIDGVDRQTDRKNDRQKDRQTDRKADRQTKSLLEELRS